MLYVEPRFAERMACIAPSYVSFEDTTQGLDSPLKPDARRFDTPSLSREAVALSRAALEVLEEPGLDAVYERARALAGRLAELLAERGHAVAPRGDTTLVAWDVPDPEEARDRLGELGIVVRNLPGRSLLRASVGAWNDESDLQRLLDAL
jgi:L-cysteine/cystine lyase